MLNLYYIAGIIDGEGCICFDYAKDTGMLRVQVRVSMAVATVPEMLYQQFGGHLIHGKATKRNTRNPIIWVVRADKACEFLEQIKDLLIIKSNQALLALYFQSVRSNIDKETHQHFKTIMHKLNKVGTDTGEIG